jgi:hypothetical protein
MTDLLTVLSSELISNIAAVHTVPSVHIVDHNNMMQYKLGAMTVKNARKKCSKRIALILLPPSGIWLHVQSMFRRKILPQSSGSNIRRARNQRASLATCCILVSCTPDFRH